MGVLVGKTPLEVEDRLVFPVAYPRDKADLYGKIVLRHEGCETVVRSLDLRASNEGLVVELDCREDAEFVDARGGRR
jgi:hypothetical protein